MSRNTKIHSLVEGVVIEVPVIGDGGDAIVVMNCQHTILPAQEELLWSSGISFSKCLIPAKGLNQFEQTDLAEYLMDRYSRVVFLSPLPLMIKYVASENSSQCLLFCNDNREKKELPNGKVISVTAKTGWYLA